MKSFAHLNFRQCCTKLLRFLAKLKNTTINEVKNAQNSVTLAEQGLNMYQWAEEDMAVYRQAVQDAWVEVATTPESQNLLNAHLDFLRDIGAMQ